MKPLVRVSFMLIATAVGVSACRPAASSLAEPYDVVHGWPALPAGFRMDHVAGLAVNSRDEVIVFHRGDDSWIEYDGVIPRPTILRIDPRSGRVLDSIGANLFRNPHGIAVDNEDNIWVTDNNLHQVFKLSSSGVVLLVVGEAGVRGNDGTHFNGVTDIAVAADGSFYVTDGYGNNRVAKFAPNGTFLFEWGTAGSAPGEFNLPHGISLDAQGRVYVADRSNVRIQVFEPDGTFLHEWKGPALGRPWGLEVGGDGFLYVADGGDYWNTGQYRSERPDTLPLDRARLLKLSLDGKVVAAWGSYGLYDGQMRWPHDVTVTADGAVFVGDIRGMRVQKFVPAR